MEEPSDEEGTWRTKRDSWRRRHHLEQSREAAGQQLHMQHRLVVRCRLPCFTAPPCSPCLALFTACTQEKHCG